MLVKVYYNLHKKCLSVVANEGENKGRVIGHVQEISLVNVVFKVSAAGRARVLKEKRKNVHATIWGRMTAEDLGQLPTAITYNPYKYSSFVNKADESPVIHAKKVKVDGRNIWAS